MDQRTPEISLKGWLDGILEPIAAESGERKQVGAVVAAARIIETLCTGKQRYRMTVIARDLGIPASSCFNILKTLVRENILDFDASTKTYGANYGLVAITRNYLGPGGPLRVVRPILEELASHREVTLVVWRRSGKHMVVVDYVDHLSPLRVHIEPGSRFPLLAGAMGRIIAAYGGLSSREIAQYFSSVKWDRPVSFDDFAEGVADTRERGWAFDDGTFSSGISTISVPIRDGNEPVDAVLSATSFVSQFNREKSDEIASELRSVAVLIAKLRVGSSL